jgi:hypothetical protein
MQLSDPAGRDVAIHLTLKTDENNPVPSRVSFVPIHLEIRYSDLRSVWNLSLSIGNDGDIVICFDLKDISFVSIGFTTTRSSRVVRLSQPLKPAPHLRRRPFPLPVVSSDNVGGGVPCQDEKGSGNDAPYRANNQHGSLRKRSLYFAKAEFGAAMPAAETDCSPVGRREAFTLLLPMINVAAA